MTRIYQRIDTRPAPKKFRLVRIIKEDVFKEIERHTYKFTEAQKADSPKQENAIAADTTENLDGASVARFIAFRHALLLDMLQAYLCDEEVPVADNSPKLEEDYRYRLLLEPEFNDATLPALAEKIHRYLVYGTLKDWYAQMGLPQAETYAKELLSIENGINDMMRTPSIAKRPLQPFGPAKPYGGNI